MAVQPFEKYPEFATELDNGLTLCGNCHSLLRGREETTDLLKFIEESPYSRDEQIVERLIAMMAEQLKVLNDTFAELTRRKAEVPIGNDNFTEPGHIQAEMLRLEAEEKLREAERLRRDADDAVKKRQREAEQKRLREAKAQQQRKAEEKRSAIRLPIVTLSGHRNEVYSVVYSPNGNIIASGSRDRTVKLWSIQNQQEIATFEGHKGGVMSVAYSPKGDTIATGANDNTIKLWSVEAGREIATFEGHKNRVMSIAYSPKGDAIATGADDGTVKLWDISPWLDSKH